MAKSKYTITQQDKAAATIYLARKVDDGYWLTEDISKHTKAEREYKKAIRDHVTLNAWCEKWLDAAQWIQLRIGNSTPFFNEVKPYPVLSKPGSIRRMWTGSGKKA